MLALDHAAGEDGHYVTSPSHIIANEREIVGCVSLGNLPALLVWSHSQKVKARESAYLLNAAENVLSARGVQQFVMPCFENSPYFPAMEKLGFVNLGQPHLFLKTLR